MYLEHITKPDILRAVFTFICAKQWIRTALVARTLQLTCKRLLMDAS